MAPEDVLQLRIWWFRLLLEEANKHPEGWRTEVAVAYLSEMYGTVNHNPKEKLKKPRKAADYSPVLRNFQQLNEAAKPAGQSVFQRLKARVTGT